MHRPLSCTFAARQAFAVRYTSRHVSKPCRAFPGASLLRPSGQAFRSSLPSPSKRLFQNHTNAKFSTRTGVHSFVERCEHAYGYWCSDGRRSKTSFASKQNGKSLHGKPIERAWVTTRVEVPVGGNGAVFMDVHVLQSLALRLAESTEFIEDTLVYIPSGPFPLEYEADASVGEREDEEVIRQRVLDKLQEESHLTDTRYPRRLSTVVRINYRLSPRTTTDPSPIDHRFPTPIHDVAMACESFLENLTTARNRDDQDPDLDPAREPRTMIFGSHFGGSLALMLALTRPNDFHAVVAYDPVVEWVGLDELAAPPPATHLVPITGRKRNKAESEEQQAKTRDAANALIDLRTTLFRNPSGFFDPFASPLLFLRAPGKDTPLWRTAKPVPDGIQEGFVTIKEAMKREGGIEVNEKNTREVIRERGYGPYDDDWHTVEPQEDSVEKKLSGSGATLDETDTSGLHQMTTDLSTFNLNDDQVQPTTLQLETDLPSQAPAPVIQQSTNHSSKESRPQTLTDLSPSPAVDVPTESSLSSLKPESNNHATTQPDSILEPTKPTSRRRKVLRRWPPLGDPEDYDLPYIKIYSTTPPPIEPSNTTTAKVDLSYVLHPQAKEMVNVMRRACFWGRDKTLGDERVVLEEVPSRHGSDVAESSQTEAASGSIDEMGEGVGFDSVAGRAVEWLSRIAASHK